MIKPLFANYRVYQITSCHLRLLRSLSNSSLAAYATTNTTDNNSSIGKSVCSRDTNKATQNSSYTVYPRPSLNKNSIIDDNNVSNCNSGDGNRDNIDGIKNVVVGSKLSFLEAFHTAYNHRTNNDDTASTYNNFNKNKTDVYNGGETPHPMRLSASEFEKSYHSRFVIYTNINNKKDIKAKTNLTLLNLTLLPPCLCYLLHTGAISLLIGSTGFIAGVLLSVYRWYEIQQSVYRVVVDALNKRLSITGHKLDGSLSESVVCRFNDIKDIYISKKSINFKIKTFKLKPLPFIPTWTIPRLPPQRHSGCVAADQTTSFATTSNSSTISSSAPVFSFMHSVIPNDFGLDILALGRIPDHVRNATSMNSCKFNSVDSSSAHTNSSSGDTNADNNNNDNNAIRNRSNHGVGAEETSAFLRLAHKLSSYTSSSQRSNTSVLFNTKAANNETSSSSSINGDDNRGSSSSTIRSNSTAFWANKLKHARLAQASGVGFNRSYVYAKCSSTKAHKKSSRDRNNSSTSVNNSSSISRQAKLLNELRLNPIRLNLSGDFEDKQEELKFIEFLIGVSKSP